VGSRDVEAIVADHGLADPPTAARLGRLAGGRPGIALAYARAPEAVLIRAELTRVLLDLTDAGPAARLAAARAAVPRAIALSAALATADPALGPAGRGRRRGAPTPVEAPPVGDGADETADLDADEPASARTKTPASERRRGVEVLLGLWTDVARDLALIGAGGGRSVHDTVLLDELAEIAASVDPAAVVAFLERSARSAEWLATNVSPELILDALVLAWPRRAVAA